MLKKYTPLLMKEFIITYKDHPGVQSIILHTDINLCQLNCYKCHNKNSIIQNKQFFSYDILDKKLDIAKIMGVELIIISGGEPTLVNEQELQYLLEFIKNKGFPIRLDTNGLQLDILEKLINKQLVDGFAIDIKIPIRFYNNDDNIIDRDRYKVILFNEKNVPDSIVDFYAETVDSSIDLAETADLKYNLYRTVRYPLLLDIDIENINKYVEEKGIKHKHKWLDFFEPPV